MKWTEFLEQILEKEQIRVLKYALKVRAQVHFYGTGLGKSTIAEVLTYAGYQATEPEGMECGHSMFVPDGASSVCFNVKKKPLENYIPDLATILKGQKDEIIRWVNSKEYSHPLGDSFHGIYSEEELRHRASF